MDFESVGHVSSKETLTFTFKRPPSKKNRMKFGWKKTKKGLIRIPIPREEVKIASDSIGAISKDAANRKKWVHNGEPLAMWATWHPDTDEVSVIVAKIPKYTPEPRKFDLQNLFEVTCDAMQNAGTITDDVKFCYLSIGQYRETEEDKEKV